jgi:hypothetical protein
MKYLRFGRNLRRFLASIGLKQGYSRWFEDNLGESKALRRWLSGEHLPSEGNWEEFVDKLSVGRDGDTAFAARLRPLQEEYRREQRRAEQAQRQRPGRRDEEALSEKINAVQTDASADPKPKDPKSLQKVWKLLTSTPFHRALGDIGWAWAAERFDHGMPIEEFRLSYQKSGPRYSIPDEGKKAFARWCATSKNAKRLKRESWQCQVRLVEARYSHSIHMYEILLAPTKFLFYRAIQQNLWKPEYRKLRIAAFENALFGLDKEEPLLLPSTFAVHMGVVSSDGQAFLRRRTQRTGLYPRRWEAGPGEFMHGPRRTKFPHFTRGAPNLFRFLKNTVAEELNYFGARPRDFLLFGFAAEFLTLAPKLMAVYFSDAPMSKLLKCAKKARDRAAELRTINLTIDGVASALSDPQYESWGPTSKLALLLALIQRSGSDGKSVIKQLEMRRRELARSQNRPFNKKKPSP